MFNPSQPVQNLVSLQDLRADCYFLLLQEYLISTIFSFGHHVPPKHPPYYSPKSFCWFKMFVSFWGGGNLALPTTHGIHPPSAQNQPHLRLNPLSRPEPMQPSKLWRLTSGRRVNFHVGTIGETAGSKGLS